MTTKTLHANKALGVKTISTLEEPVLKWIGGFLVVVGGVFVGLYLYERFTIARAENAINELQKKDLLAADNALKEYYVVAGQGDPRKTCFQAKQVAALYLQAGREGEYMQWKQTAESDCRGATTR